MSSPSTTPPPVRYAEFCESLPDGPVALPELIEGAAPLELDIGFGRGHSLLERARDCADVRVLGIEIKAKWAHKVEQRRAREGLTHARALQGDIREILPRASPDACLSRVSVHFPDPWWKKRHQKRIVVQDEVLEQLARLLAPGGALFIQTDVEARAAEYEALVAAHEAFEPWVGESYRVAENPTGARSNRELRAIEDGLPIHRVLARRV